MPIMNVLTLGEKVRRGGEEMNKEGKGDRSSG